MKIGHRQANLSEATSKNFRGLSCSCVYTLSDAWEYSTIVGTRFEVTKHVTSSCTRVLVKLRVEYRRKLVGERQKLHDELSVTIIKHQPSQFLLVSVVPLWFGVKVIKIL